MKGATRFILDNMAKTTVKMNTCNKTHHITVTLRDDGNLDVDIKTDCPHVQEYADKLKVITMEDVTSWKGSKVNDPEIRESLSVPCLVPCGVLDAAWIELEMLSSNLCKKVHSNEIILDEN